MSWCLAGRIGASHPKSPGGGSTHLCLPSDPEYSKRDKGKNEYRADIYGVKYKDVEEVFSITKTNQKKLNNYVVPCAVCFVRTRGVQLMLPAKNTCPFGWTKEYHGYLMTQNRKLRRTDFICVDIDAEKIDNSNDDSESPTLDFTEGKCGSLPCPLYREDWELSCAVCTR